MKIKARNIEILKSINGTKLMLEIDKESVNSLTRQYNEKTLSGDLAIEIKKWREKRSLNANAYFHLLVNKIADKLNDSDYNVKVRLNTSYGTIATDSANNQIIIKLPKQADITEFYDYAKWIADKTEKDGVETSYYVFYKQTSKLDTKEMTRLIDGTIQEAQELGIDTVTPNEKAKMLAQWESAR